MRIHARLYPQTTAQGQELVFAPRRLAASVPDRRPSAFATAVHFSLRHPGRSISGGSRTGLEAFYSDLQR